MSYTIKDYKTKKKLKADLVSGEIIRCYNPGLGDSLENFTGSVSLEGMHYPKMHTWYAQAILKDGVVISIK